MRDPKRTLEFLVVIEDAAGQRRGTLTPEEFRRGASCPKAYFLKSCVDDWNAYQERRGAEDRARIEILDVIPPKRRGRGRVR